MILIGVLVLLVVVVLVIAVLRAMERSVGGYTTLAPLQTHTHEGAKDTIPPPPEWVPPERQRKYVIAMEPDCDEMYRFLVWLSEEWDGWIIPKFGGTITTMGDEDMLELGFNEDSWWFRQVHQYIDRVNAFGLDTLKGRQAMAKATATMMAATGAAIRAYGQLPKGGTTSGEIRER